MSQPLIACTVIRAIKGNQNSRDIVIMRLQQTNFSFWPCSHNPPCEQPTDAQTRAFLDNLEKTHIAAARKLAHILTPKN